MHVLIPEQTRFLRLRSQRLHPQERQSDPDVASLVKALGGVQAQEPQAAALAIRARSRGLTASDVERARVEKRSIIRCWALRGTLHLLATEDIGWMLPLLGPVFIRKGERRFKELGLDEETRKLAVPAIRDILGKQGPLTRAELANQLEARGISTEGQRAYHLIRLAGLEGVVCYGPDHDRDETYVLLDGWAKVDWAEAGDEATSRLAHRYIAGYGPVTAKDFATWSGLSMKEARAGFEMNADALAEVEVDGSPAWMLESRAGWLDELDGSSLTVNLVPGYDPYLLGYQNRDLIVAAEHAKQVHPGGGTLRPTLLVDGQAAGIWRLKRGRGSVQVVLEPFGPLSAAVVGAVEEEAQHIGRFLDVDTSLEIA